MSNVGVHDFTLPHEYAQPTRDMVVVRLPHPPKKIGSLEVPDTFREMAKYNVMAGRVVAMGPLAFTYKDGNGNVVKQDVKIGDWIAFRPFAGTQTIGGIVAGAGNWRYLSSFQDIISVYPSNKMPAPETLIWDDDKDAIKSVAPVPKDFDIAPRERIKG